MPEFAPGSVFAGHRIEGLAGRGGMGVVYRATQLALERLVALKVIAPALAEDPDFRRRFVRESKAAASIEHPNVIPIYYAGERDGVLFIAMRYVHGEDLRALVRAAGGLEAQRAVHILAQVAAALDAAHERGLVHRDVKPANVLTTPAGRSAPDGGGARPSDHAYLTDFGLTKRELSAASGISGGGWVGTLGYVAPEQIRGERVDARADVYALGCVLVHALTGEAPYVRESDEATLWAHLNAPPPSDEVPPAFAGVIARALAKDPSDRYPSAGDLGRAALAAAGVRDDAGPERMVARGAAAPRDARAAAVWGRAQIEHDTFGAELLPEESGGAAFASTVAPGEIPAAPRPPAAPPHGVGDHAHDDDAWSGWMPGTAEAPGIPDATAATGAAAGATTAEEPRRRRRRTAMGSAAATVGAAVVAVVAILLASGGDPATPDRRTAARAPEMRVVERVPVGARPNAMTVAGGAVWVASQSANDIALIDAQTNERDGRVEVGEGAAALDGGFGSVWVAKQTTDTLLRIGSKTRTRDTAAIALPSGQAVAVAAGEGSVWVGVRSTIPGFRGAETVAKVDPETNQVQQTLSVEGGVQDVAVGEGAVWVSNRFQPTVTRIGIESGSRRVVPVGRRPQGIEVGYGAVWVALAGDDAIARIHAEDRTVRSTQLEDTPSRITVGADSVWATARAAGRLLRLSRGGRVRGTLDVGRRPFALDVTESKVFVTLLGEDAVDVVQFPGG